MKRADKLLLFLCSLICLGLSIGLLSIFYPLPFVSDAVGAFRSAYYWADSVIAGFCAFICLLFISLMLFSVFVPSRQGNLILPKSKGTLRFSKQAIESTAKYSFYDLGGINLSQVNARIHKKPEKLKIFVKLSLSDLDRMVELTEAVQQRIEEALLSSLGITAKSINVKVIKYKSNNRDQAESGESMPVESRVE